ncbi:MAG: hypothetical protein N2050_10610 [Flavobacteriales bacterium]|nr:hypothetical protein [Flavobacteriales bacterium]
MRCKPTQGPGGRWLSRHPRRRIQAPPWQGSQGRGLFHAMDATMGFEQPVLRYAAQSAATQEPGGVLWNQPFGTACCTSLLRYRACGG